MQYRHPMHFDSSYNTGPSALFVNAPTGQTDAHVGSIQCWHILRTNIPSCSSSAVYAVAESCFSSPSRRLYSFLHASWHALHPMHIVVSMRRALLLSISNSFQLLYLKKITIEL